MPDRDPVRLPLIVRPSNRGEDTTTDARLVNAFVEILGQDEQHVCKRPGMSSYSSASAAAGRGIYLWNGNVYSIWGNTLYKDNVAVAGTVDTTNGVYTFSSCLGATPKLFFQNGVKAYTYDSGAGLVQVTDVDYPSTTQKGQAYLDGTTYVMTASANIQGSDLNNPQSWQALNSIIAQIEPDGGVGLAKQLVYVIAFKQFSVEVFYDAGNASGSPLGQVQGAKVNTGCRHQDTIRELEGALFWVGQTRGGGLSVMIMDGLKAQKISTPPIERLLETGDFTTVYSWTAKIDGHRLYVLTLVNSNLTLVYDLDSRMWSQFTDTNGNYLPIVASTVTPVESTLVQHASNGQIYTFDTEFFTDAGSLIPVDIYTPNFDGGTRRKKYLHSMDFAADQTAGSILTVRVSDDDYMTWSNPRTVDLSLKRPYIDQCGSFRKRAFHFRHACNTRFRIQAVDLNLDVGTL